jgi:hypothetical protein
MGSLNLRRKFDPLDPEIIDRVYEVACAYIDARDLYRDNLYRDSKNCTEEEDVLRKPVFGCANTGPLNFDTLATERWRALTITGPSPEVPDPHVRSSMRTMMFIAGMFAAAVSMSPVPATAAPQSLPGGAAAKAQSAFVEDIGWRRRYWRHGYPVPYAYYPPAYGYYPPPAYGYYAPVYPAYPYYSPYRYYRPYYAPY